MADIGNFETIDDTEIKNTYPKGTFNDMFSVRAPYRDKLRKDTSFARDAEGIVKFPLRFDGMWAVGITADNAAFPTPRDPNRQQGEIRMVTFTTAIQIGLQTSILAKSSKSTFQDGGTTGDRIEGAADELASYINRVYCGSNRGRLAVVESDGSSNFVAKVPHSVKLLEVGMALEAYTALSGGSVRDSFSNHLITAIDRDTRTVTYIKASDLTTDDRTLVAGDSIFISGTYARSPIGLPDIVDDGTLLGTIFTKSRTTYPKLKAPVFGNGGTLRPISADLLMSGCDRIRETTNQRPTRVLMNRGLFRSLSNAMNLDRQFIGNGGNALERPMGYDANSFKLSTFDADVTFSLDDHCLSRSAFILSWATFFLCEPMPLDWISELGLIPTDGGHKAGFIKEMASVENQGCLMPMANVRIDDLADPGLGDAA